MIRNDDGDIFMIHLPKWGKVDAHWDFPGGRMDPGESFLETLDRELQEEIGISFSEQPVQIMGMLTNITLPVNNEFLPLTYMIYEVKLNTGKIKLAEDIREDNFGWFKPK